jgi:DNA-directed RNA polymerase subunit RPC12/RpoP
MLRHCISDAISLRSADLRLSAEEGIRLGHIFHLAPADVRRMTHADVPQSATCLLAPKPIQICLDCSEKNAQKDAAGAILRSSLEGWRITCPVCGSKLFEAGQDKAKFPQETATQFPELWDQALHGQRLFDDAIVPDKWPWASPIHVFRMLLLLRLCKGAEVKAGIHHGRAANVIIPGFDETVQRLRIEFPRTGRRIVPMSIRSALIAAVSIVINKGPISIMALSEAAMGVNHPRFDKIVSQMQAEIRARKTISELLQL